LIDVSVSIAIARPKAVEVPIEVAGGKFWDDRVLAVSFSAGVSRVALS